MVADAPTPQTPSPDAGMAARMRAHDWAATSLGPMEAWPPALRAVIATALRSGLPTVVLAGDDLRVCALNDAYRPLLGDKPPALGRPMTEVWSEAAAIIAPQMAAARRGETVAFRDAPFRLERGPCPDDAWFDYSFSPVLDEAGAVVGVLHTTIETTDRVLERMAREALEAARLERETSFEQAVEAARTGWATYEPEAGLVTADARARRIRGLPQEAAPIPAEVWIAQVHPEDRDAYRALSAQALEEGAVFDLHYRILRPDGELRRIHGRAWRLTDVTGGGLRLRGLLIDETEAWRREEERRAREALLRLALDAAEAGWIVTDQTAGTAEFDERARRFYGAPPAPAPLTIEALRARIHPDDRAAVAAEIARATEEGGRYALRYRVDGAEDGARHLVERGVAARGTGEAFDRFSGLLFDETEAVRRETRRELMIRELNHRVKNMFAVVQSIATETFRGRISAQDAVSAFEERMAALAAAHDLLVRDASDVAELRALIRAAIQLNGAAPRVTLEGPDVAVPASRVVGLTMAFHELRTNAAKYGALSNEGGRVAVRWSLEAGPPRRLEIEWRESGGPPVSPPPPERRGFGAAMIEEALAYEFDTVALEFQPQGVVCRIAGDWPEEPTP